jgi:hypothetical protein
MVTVLINHEVSNYQKWEEQFDLYEPIRTMAGFKLIGIYCLFDDAQKLVILFEAPSIAAIKKVFNDPKLQADMLEAGVIKKPVIQILNKLVV